MPDIRYIYWDGIQNVDQSGEVDTDIIYKAGFADKKCEENGKKQLEKHVSSHQTPRSGESKQCGKKTPNIKATINSIDKEFVPISELLAIQLTFEDYYLIKSLMLRIFAIDDRENIEERLVHQLVLNGPVIYGLPIEDISKKENPDSKRKRIENHDEEKCNTIYNTDCRVEIWVSTVANYFDNFGGKNNYKSIQQKTDDEKKLAGDGLTASESGSNLTSTPGFSKVLFFSGSIGFTQEIRGQEKEKEAKEKKFMNERWNYKDFVWNIKNRLADNFKDSDWQYLLSQQEPPVYEAGRKKFKLITSKNLLPHKTSMDDLGNWLDGEGEEVGGFACTASVSGNNSGKTKHERVALNKTKNIYENWKRETKEHEWEVIEGGEWKKWTPKPGQIIYKLQQDECLDDGNDYKIEDKRVTAIKKFQAKKGLVQDGELNSATKNKMFPDGPKRATNDAKSNQSSRVPGNQLSEFVNKLFDKKADAPAFSICDCNSFHTSGYLWGMYANKIAEKSESLKNLPLVVLNFDSHEDYGSHGKSDDPRSDGWGGMLMRDLGLKNCCYAKIGAGANYYVFDESKSPQKGSVDLDGFWSMIKDLFKKTAVKVFISVDRDCIEYHQTQWTANPPYKNTDELKADMSKLLKGLDKDDYLIGCDVTGLPESDLMACQDAKCQAKSLSSAWNDTADQINMVHDLVIAKLLQTAQLLNGKDE